ncbi:MAG: precorrin-6Y C5,15-methyltransferase (decarboxylating) subunit CbiT [Schwartzia sp.]|nr:precorrin-6Y C5,15-methyltransferase (decarboxylating) subunit CbiT [Schwartzia sp. (in: firmicutes)]
MTGLGIEDEAFIRGKVPMTKQEIRVLTMVKARISPTDVVWDVGAGTGSMSVEAARLAPQGHVYAIERNAEGVSLIEKNKEKFGVGNLTVVEGDAPDALKDLPDCDAAIIGGSGSRLSDILDEISSRLKTGGRVVMNCITVQTLAASLSYMRAHETDFSYEAIQVQINRLQAVGAYDMAKAINPIYIVTAEKK